MAEPRYTNAEKLECIRRERKLREHVYPQRIRAGKMSPQLANEQLRLIKAIEADYEELAKGERLI